MEGLAKETCAETVGGKEDKLKDIKIHCQRLDPDDKVVYSHESKQRCAACFSNECKSYGTRLNGYIKRFKCKKCGNTWKSVGKKI